MIRNGQQNLKVILEDEELESAEVESDTGIVFHETG